MPGIDLFPGIMLALAFAALAAVMLRAVDPIGAVFGCLTAFLIFLGGGFPAIILLGLFFLVGSLATVWNMQKKISSGLAQENKGRRSVSNVLGNGGVAAVLGLLAWRFPEHSVLLQYMIAASLASATSDTLSSEMGNVYGSRFYKIPGLGPGRRGEDGAASPEGTAFGLIGSAGIALAYGFTAGWNRAVAWIAIAGFLGNLTDSILGGSLQKGGYLNNHGVNFLSTLAAALFAGGMALLAGVL